MDSPNRWLGPAFIAAGVGLILLGFALDRAPGAELLPCDSAVAGLSLGFGTVAQAAERVSGAEVRVRLITGPLAYTSLDAWEAAEEARCPSWRGPGGQRKSTLLVVAISPDDRRQVGVYFGTSLAPRLAGKWQDAARDHLIPALQAYQAKDGPTVARELAATVDALGAMLVRPANAGPTVINNSAPSVDYTWVWMTLLALFAAFAACLAIIWIIITRNRNHSAQAEARRLRSAVVSGLLEVSDEPSLEGLAATNPGPRGAATVARVRFLANAASEALSRFDDAKGADPNAAPSSAEVYRERAAAYTNILERFIRPAQRELERLRSGELSSTGPEFTTRYTTVDTPVRRPEPRVDAPTPRPTYVGKPSRIYRHQRMHGGDGPSTTVFAPVIINTPTRDDDPPARPNWLDTAPSRDSGGSFSAPSSSDSGGSFSAPTSYDSGGSFSSSSDSGGSDGGGGGGGSSSSD